MRVAAQDLENRAAKVRKQATEWLEAEAMLEERTAEAAMPYASSSADPNARHRAEVLRRVQVRLVDAADALQPVGFINLLPG